MANKIMLAVAAGFLLLGLGSLIVGIVVPITLHNQLVEKGRIASRIEATEDPEVWANIPGDRGYNLTQEYEFFEILNPSDYKYGIQPQARSVGTVMFSERRTTISNITSQEVETYDNKKEIMFDFTQVIDLDIVSGQEVIDKEILTPNPEVYAQLAATRDATPWHVAIRALKQIIDFTVNEYYKRAIVADLTKRFNSYSDRNAFISNRGNLLVQNGLTREQALAIFDSKAYGFSDPDNIRVWADSCDSSVSGYNRKLLMDFFDINSNAMNAFTTQLCIDWNEARRNVDTYACVNTNCEGQGIFYKQWSNGTISQMAFQRSSMNHIKHVNGEPEISSFLQKVFFPSLNAQQKALFEGVDFMRRLSAYGFSQLFDPEDLAYSLYNFTTVKTMFDIGEKVDAEATETSIDFYQFEEITTYMNIEPREAYVLYKYLRNLAAKTYLQEATPDMASFATITAPILRKEMENFVVDFGSEYVARGLFRYMQFETCQDAFRRLFPTKSGNAGRVCAQPRVSPNTLDGLRLWLRLFIGRRQEDEKILHDYTSYYIKDFETEFDDTGSGFHKHINSILDAVGIGRLDKNICNQDYNDLCSINEIAMSQWLNSEFTLFLPIMFENEYSEHFSWIDAFRQDERDELLKSEINYFIHIQPIFEEHNITLNHIYSDFKPHKLYEPLFFMSYLQQKADTDTPFDDDVFVSYVGVIYKNRNYPTLIVKKTVLDLLYESESEYLIRLQKAPLAENGNPLVRTTYNALRYPELKGNIVHWQILAGHNHEDYVRRVFTYNDTEHTYAVTNRTFWHENSTPKRSHLEYVTYQPWKSEVHLAFGSDSIQYEPNIGTKKDIAYYSPFLKAQVGLDYIDISSVHDTKTYDYALEGNIFQVSDPGDQDNKYHNYVYHDSFNATEIFSSSLFVTSPLYSSFRESMKPNAWQLIRDGKRVEFKHENDTSVEIEFYSGIALSSRQSYQFNYVFDTYSLGLDSFTFFLPSHIYTAHLLIGADFTKTYFSEIRTMEKTRKLILIICFAVGGVLFALGISACIIIFIKSNKEESIPDEDERNVTVKDTDDAIN